MAEFPHMPIATDAYLGDTTHLRTIEHGAYFLLLMAAWRTRGRPQLPNDDKLLARYAGVNMSTWLSMKPNVMAFWSLGEDDFFTQKKQLEVRERTQKVSREQSEKSRKRWDAKRLADQQLGDAAALPDPMHPYPYPSSDTDVSGAEGAPVDFKKAVFDEGTALIMERTGKARGVAANIIGKWRKDTKDADAKILERIRAAKAQGVADPVAWITAALKTQSDYDFIWARG